MTVINQPIDQCVAVRPFNMILACRINIRYRNNVCVIETAAKLVKQILKTCEAMWLMDGDNAPIAVETMARGLEHPWALQFLPEGRLLVTERPGRMRIIAADGKERILLWNNGDVGSGSLAEQIQHWPQPPAIAERPEREPNIPAGESP